MIPQTHARAGRWAQAVSVLCIFLVLLVSGVQATHVHPDTARRDCSLCVVAQAGAVVTATFHAAPYMAPSRAEVTPEPIHTSHLSTPSLYIRPPPSV